MNDHETGTYTPVKVYCDATTKEHEKHESGISAVGIIVTNHNGKIIHRGGRTIGTGYGSLAAEKAAIEHALHVLSGYDGVGHVIAYSDCKFAIDSAGDEIKSEYSDQFESLSIEWIGREDNVEADMQADIEANRHAGTPLGASTQQTKYGLTD
jgi:ribonuclease HI